MQTIILNADYSYLNTVSWQKAITLLSKGKVEVLKYSEELIRSAGNLVMKIPLVMRLIKLVRTLYRTKVPFSKRSVIVRDGFKCAYCGETRKRFTIDHIIPKSRGGKSTFENCVASCLACNAKKGNRTPNEARMPLKVKAFQPTISEFLRIKLEKLGAKKVLDEFFNEMM